MVLQILKKLIHNFTKARPPKNTLLVEAVTSTFNNKKLFDSAEPQISAEQVKQIYLNDSFVYGAVNRLADAVTSEGYAIVGDNPKEVKKVEEWCENVGIMLFLRKIVLNMVLFDDTFIELRDDGPFLVEPGTMKVVYDKYGRVQGYKQQLPGRNPKDQPVFSPDRIIHIKSADVGADIYGVSPIKPLQSIIASKMFSETYFAIYLKRMATPKLIFRYPLGASRIKDELKTMLSSQKAYEDWILPKDIEIEQINFGTNAEVVRDWLNYIREEILVALGVPSIVLGVGTDANKANASVQIKSFRYRVKAIQNYLKHIINSRILPKYFPRFKVKFMFKQVDAEDTELIAKNRYRMAQTLGWYVKWGILTPEEAKEVALDDLKRNRIYEGIG